MKIRLIAILVTLGVLFSTQALASPKFVVCDYCTSAAHFFIKATQSADPVAEQSEMYIINRLSVDIRFYTVTRTFVGGSAFPDEYIVNATAGPGDPVLVDQLRTGLNAFWVMLRTNKDIQASDLNIPGIDSALDLIGPIGIASRNRRALVLALTDHFRQFDFGLQVGAAISGLVRTLVSGLATHGMTVNISFGDGTTVNVEITSVNVDISNGNSFELKFKVDLQSIRLANGQPAPTALAEFNGLVFSGGGGSSRNLGELFGRLGGSGAFVGGSTHLICVTQTFHCDRAGHCTVTVGVANGRCK